ncbi:MAG: hypothetical protein ABIR52_03060 [Casimicrobiaceae bacterium]
MTDASDPPNHLQEARLWRDQGWTARVVKNEDDDGWAVEMTKDGEQAAALVGPWTMGRDKKNPKPLDATAFSTLVKTAHEVRRRHEQHLHALLHKKVIVSSGDGEIVVTLDTVVEDESPYALLAARPALEPDAAPLAEVRVDTSFKLTVASAQAWIDDGYRRPE